jgi:GTP-binding protein
LRVSAEFIISAAGPGDFPTDDLPEVAVVGRSNVGKSSLINALTRQRVARTSRTPGKTRLANIYRVERGNGPFYLVDLPGYGYARAARPGSSRPERGSKDGRLAAAQEFAELTAAYFARGRASALLLVDTRHPGMESDIAAWDWLQSVTESPALVATKIDKLARGERIRATGQLESVFDTPVLPVSAVTGEGLDELWKLIDRQANSRNSRTRGRPPLRPEATAALPRPTAKPAKSTKR